MEQIAPAPIPKGRTAGQPSVPEREPGPLDPPTGSNPMVPQLGRVLTNNKHAGPAPNHEATGAPLSACPASDNCKEVYVSTLDPLLERNRAFAAAGAWRGLGMLPAH